MLTEQSTGAPHSHKASPQVCTLQQHANSGNIFEKHQHLEKNALSTCVCTFALKWGWEMISCPPPSILCVKSSLTTNTLFSSVCISAVKRRRANMTDICAATEENNRAIWEAFGQFKDRFTNFTHRDRCITRPVETVVQCLQRLWRSFADDVSVTSVWQLCIFNKNPELQNSGCEFWKTWPFACEDLAEKLLLVMGNVGSSIFVDWLRVLAKSHQAFWQIFLCLASPLTSQKYTAAFEFYSFYVAAT